jgi:putative colanic acid biosynthesis acetyltransferase WcaF
MNIGRKLDFKIRICYHVLLGRIVGIQHIVRYLRNPDPRLTPSLLKAFGAKIGERTTFKRTVYFDNVTEDVNSARDFSHLEIGNNCYIGDGVYFDLAGQIVLGENVVVSARSSFITHQDCNRSPFLSKQFPRKCGSIVVKDNSWVAFQSCILHGVTIGPKSVVAAYSLVRSDVEELSIHGGIPSKQLGRLS